MKNKKVFIIALASVISAGIIGSSVALSTSFVASSADNTRCNYVIKGTDMVSNKKENTVEKFAYKSLELETENLIGDSFIYDNTAEPVTFIGTTGKAYDKETNFGGFVNGLKTISFKGIKKGTFSPIETNVHFSLKVWNSVNEEATLKEYIIKESKFTVAGSEIAFSQSFADCDFVPNMFRLSLIGGQKVVYGPENSIDILRSAAVQPSELTINCTGLKTNYNMKAVFNGRGAVANNVVEQDGVKVAYNGPAHYHYVPTYNNGNPIETAVRGGNVTIKSVTDFYAVKGVSIKGFTLGDVYLSTLEVRYFNDGELVETVKNALPVGFGMPPENLSAVDFSMKSNKVADAFEIAFVYPQTANGNYQIMEFSVNYVVNA